MNKSCYGVYCCDMRQSFIKASAFLVLWVVLWFVCRGVGDGMLVHKAVADALEHGTGWGRSMLAGSWQYPPLPSLAMLFLGYPARLLSIDAARLYVTFSQVCIVWQLLMLCGWRRCWCALLPILLPRVFVNMCVGEAGWLAAALFTMGLCSFIRWQEEHALREIILGGVFFGMLALCGAFPAILGLAGVVWFWYCARPGVGLRTLLWSVWAYCILLLLLWNWLVLGKPFYAFAGVSACFSRVGLSAILAKFDSIGKETILSIFFPLAPLCIFASKSSQKNAAKYMVFCMAVLLVYIPICLALSVPDAVGSAFFCTFIMAICTIASKASFPKAVSRNAAILALCISSVYSFVPVRLPGAQARIQAPAREEITDFIDRLWPDSRTMLYGTRLPALYPDVKEHRFLASIEYSKDELLSYASKEQLHLLLPPPESSLFPRDPQLLELYNAGAPWLFLERKWDDGWKLWRIIRPELETDDDAANAN